MNAPAARALLAYDRLARATMLVLALALGCRPAPTAVPPFGAPVAASADWPDARVIQFGMDRLHRHVQPDGPVGVVQESEDVMSARLGFAVLAYTERCGPGYLIHLGSDLHGELLLDVLGHEWAHTLSFGETTSHGPQWGIELSRVYRAVSFDIDTEDATVAPPPCPLPRPLPYPF
jgi:hypothetical protein